MQEIVFNNNFSPSTITQSWFSREPTKNSIIYVVALNLGKFKSLLFMFFYEIGNFFFIGNRYNI